MSTRIHNLISLQFWSKLREEVPSVAQGLEDTVAGSVDSGSPSTGRDPIFSEASIWYIFL